MEDLSLQFTTAFTLLFTLAYISITIIILFRIIKAIKAIGKSKYELERYKAETERMKAEAMLHHATSSAPDAERNEGSTARSGTE